jgi:hypothetical protein
MPFHVRALPRELFEYLFTLSPEELTRHRAVRQTVTATPGTPCRVSLRDAEPGEEVILLHYVHQPAESPFHASHAIYVRVNAVQAQPLQDEIPAFLRPRLLSLRAFDERGMMQDAEVVEGELVEPEIQSLLQRPQVAYLHVHNARQGCYLARVDPAF